MWQGIALFTILTTLLALSGLGEARPVWALDSPLPAPSAYLPAVASLPQSQLGTLYGCPPGSAHADCLADLAEIADFVVAYTDRPDSLLSWPLPVWLMIPFYAAPDPDTLASLAAFRAERPHAPIILGNEPNGRPWIGAVEMPAEEYAAWAASWLPYLQGAPIALASMADIEDPESPWYGPTYLSAVMDTLGPVDVAYVDIHLYRWSNAARDLDAMLAWRDANLPAAEVVVTEFGCASCPGQTVEDATAQLERMYSLLHSRGIRRAAWYSYWNSGTVWPWSFLVTPDGAPNEPLWSTYLEVARPVLE